MHSVFLLCSKSYAIQTVNSTIKLVERHNYSRLNGDNILLGGVIFCNHGALATIHGISVVK